MPLPDVLAAAGFNRLVKGRHGWLLSNANDEYVGRAIQTYGEYSELEVALFAQVCAEDCRVVEVGANLGAHTVALAKMVGGASGRRGRVYAFEPQRVVFQTLCANLALNSIVNVEAFQAAAGAQDGYAQIPEIDYTRAGNFGAFEIGAAAQGSRVPVVRLDTFLDLPSLRLLKIDVEGMELEVLAGATGLLAAHQPLLYVENDRPQKSAQLIEFLWAQDYRLYWHVPPLYNPENFAGVAENLYPGIASFNMLGVHRSTQGQLNGFEEITDAGFHPLRPRQGA